MEDSLPPFPPVGTSQQSFPGSCAVTLPQPAPSFTDRSGGLMIFGIVQIILGLLCSLLIPFTLFGAFMSRIAPGGITPRAGQIASGIVNYAVVAAAFIIFGIGSTQSKRWARALTLIFSWYGLLMGALITVFMTAVIPVAMKNGMARAQQTAPNASAAAVSTAVIATVVTVLIVFMALFLIAVPLAFIIFYSRKDVELTCRERDPVERWTDRSPLPVLGASCVLFLGALLLLSSAVTYPFFPFFGRYLSGVVGGACFVALAAIDLYLSFSFFRLRATAWWIAIFVSLFRIISMGLTFARGNLNQIYSKLGLSESQLQRLNENPITRSHIFLWWGFLFSVIFFGYLIWLKRYFNQSPVPQPTDGGYGAA